MTPAFFSGVAGVLFAMLEGSVGQEILFWAQSGDVVLMNLIGGMHVFLGPVMGPLIVVLFFPKGVVGTLVEVLDRKRAMAG